MKRLLIYMVCVGLFAGCSPEDRPAVDSGQIRFVSGVSVEVSRATGPVSGNVLPQDSRIGLFAVAASSTGGSDAPAIIMNNLPGTVGAEGAIDYDPVQYYEAGKKYSFYACYPYTASDRYSNASEAPRLTVSLEKQAGAQDDYLWATLSEVTPQSAVGTGVQKFTFGHALCQVRVRIWNGSGAEVPLGSITLKAPASGVLSLADGSWSDIEATSADGFSEFTLYSPPEATMLPKDAFYEVPASLLQLPVNEAVMKTQTFSLTIDGKSYAVTPSSPAGGWQSGYSYIYTVWYATEGITFQGTVGPWQQVNGGPIDTEE